MAEQQRKGRRSGLERRRQRLASLLAAGGDERIAADPLSGANAYGCASAPQSAVLEFSSSTASTISAGAFQAAMRRLEEVDDGACPHRLADDVRRRLACLCGLSETAAEDIILGASGTDLHLIAADLARGGSPGPLICVMPDARESGRGVASALRGASFSGRPPYGRSPSLGQAAPWGHVLSVPVRGPSGEPLAADLVDAQAEAACEKAARARERVLLVMLDVSKTGLLAPSAACAQRLKRRFASRLDVLVDACQFRISPLTLKGRLDCGFLVAVTGSKFVGGPAFSGALFIPPSERERLRRSPVSQVTAAHSARAEWPAAYAGRALLADLGNPGLILRWEAALHELGRFRAANPARICAVLDHLARHIDARLAQGEDFIALARPPLARAEAGGWDARASIFPFLLRRNGRVADVAETRRIHRDAADPGLTGPEAPARFGQPVSIGWRDGVELAALRLAVSAGQLARATASASAQEALANAALLALDRLVAAARRS